MRSKIILTVVGVLLFCEGLVQATPITIAISGNITSATGSALPSTIHIGNSFTGIYTYDSSALDSDSSPQMGIYHYDSPYGISIVVGGYEFTTPANHVGQFDMRIVNDVYSQTVTQDMYYVVCSGGVSNPSVGTTIDYIDWLLMDDNTHTALSSDVLPLTAPVLTNWNHNSLEISSATLGILMIRGTVTQAVLIPEPLTGFLMAMGVFFLRRRQ